MDLPENHALKEISKLIFENEVHKLIPVKEENNQEHRGHISPEELKENLNLEQKYAVF